jgi:hypothetical protein
MFEAFHYPQPEKTKPSLEIDPAFIPYVPEDFKNDPFGYFEREGKNIKSGEITYKESGEISEDPTAVKDLPIWAGADGSAISVVAKRINTAKSEVRRSQDPYYECHIMEFARAFGLPCPRIVLKAESTDQFLFVTERVKGMRGLEKEMRFLKENGFSDADMESIKIQAETMMKALKERYDAVGIARKWELKDMVFDVDLENKKIISLVPTDFEKTKIDQPKFFEARERKLKS